MGVVESVARGNRRELVDVAVKVEDVGSVAFGGIGHRGGGAILRGVGGAWASGRGFRIV